MTHAEAHFATHGTLLITMTSTSDENKDANIFKSVILVWTDLAYSLQHYNRLIQSRGLAFACCGLKGP